MILVRTTKIFSGTNTGVGTNTTNIDVEITVYSKDDPDTILLKGTYSDVFGQGKMGYTQSSGYRISECYASVGNQFANYIRKKAN